MFPRVLSLVCLTLALAWPSLSQAHPAFCSGGDVPCLIATLAKFQLDPDRRHTLELGAGTFTLTRPDNDEGLEGENGLPAIIGDVRIVGAGADLTIIERDPTSPFFRIMRATPGSRLVLEGLTIQGGELDPRFFYRVGGVASEDGDMVITDSILRNNSARRGGGVGSTGTLHLTRVVIEQNAAETGAGIAVNAELVVIDQCWIEGNVSDFNGAGIAFAPAGKVIIKDSVILENIALDTTGGGIDGGGDVEVLRTLFLQNSAGARAGAINLTSGTLSMRNSVCTGNVGEVFGGCLSVERGAVELVQTAIVNNRVGQVFGVGGGIFQIGGTVRLRRSVLAGNQAFESPDCFGEVTLVGQKNVLGDPSGCTVTQE